MSETKAPTGKQIDIKIIEYSELKKAADDAKQFANGLAADAENVKLQLVTWVEEFGGRHTDKSKRLVGIRNSATTTTATKMTVDDKAVDALREFLSKQDEPHLADSLFSAHTTYQLVQTPQEVLKTLPLATKLRNKITALLGVCFQMKTNAPSLKIDVGEAA